MCILGYYLLSPFAISRWINSVIRDIATTNYHFLYILRWRQRKTKVFLILLLQKQSTDLSSVPAATEEAKSFFHQNPVFSQYNQKKNQLCQKRTKIKNQKASWYLLGLQSWRKDMLKGKKGRLKVLLYNLSSQYYSRVFLLRHIWIANYYVKFPAKNFQWWKQRTGVSRK